MDVAESRMQIDQCRLLVLKAAHAIDCNGTKAARKEVRVDELLTISCIPSIQYNILKPSILTSSKLSFSMCSYIRQ